VFSTGVNGFTVRSLISHRSSYFLPLSITGLQSKLVAPVIVHTMFHFLRYIFTSRFSLSYLSYTPESFLFTLLFSINYYRIHKHNYQSSHTYIRLSAHIHQSYTISLTYSHSISTSVSITNCTMCFTQSIKDNSSTIQ
jgi:hypothetical protein